MAHDELQKEAMLRGAARAAPYLLLGASVLALGWGIGSLVPQFVFWILLVLIVGGWIFLRSQNRVKAIHNARKPMSGFIKFIGVLAVGSCWAGSANHDAIAASYARTRAVQAANDAAGARHRQEAIQNHNRRLAWNIAHPEEVAKLRAQVKAKIAAAKLARDKQIAAAQLASAAREKEDAAAAAALSDRINDEAQRVCDSISSAAPGSVKSCRKLDDTTMEITVDADDYNAFGPQDQKLIRAGYFGHWVKVWETDHPDKQGESNLYLGIKDLVGNDLGVFTFSSAQPGV